MDCQWYPVPRLSVTHSWGTLRTCQKGSHAKPIFTLRWTGSLHYWHGCHSERLVVTHSGVGKPVHAHVHMHKGHPFLLSSWNSCLGFARIGSKMTCSTQTRVGTYVQYRTYHVYSGVIHHIQPSAVLFHRTNLYMLVWHHNCCSVG